MTRVRIRLGYTVVHTETGQALQIRKPSKGNTYGIIYPTKRGARAAIGQAIGHHNIPYQNLKVVPVSFNPEDAEGHIPVRLRTA